MRAKYDLLRGETLEPLASKLESHIRLMLSSVKRIDRIVTRAKSTDRFLAKAAKTIEGVPKYADPFHQIQDQVGARVVTFYLTDVIRISEEVEKYFRPIESKAIIPDSEAEFGYFGKHYILIIPTDVYDKELPFGIGPRFFELQIKTLFQHAWSEAEHDLAYKPITSLTRDQKRRIAFTAAQAWGADMIFDELNRDLNHIES
jgi:ppGpp synthetase/RelA/SpoT-type nucleotidyltranferase